MQQAGWKGFLLVGAGHYAGGCGDGGEVGDNASGSMDDPTAAEFNLGLPCPG